MKIVHVLYSGLGGHSNVFFSMVKADEKKEFEYKAIFNGIEDVRQDYIDSCHAYKIPWSFLKKKPGKHLVFFWQMLKAIRASKADIIFLHGSVYAIPAKIATWFSGKSQKIVVRETQANHLKSKNEWLALKIAMMVADKIVFLSNEYITEVKKKLGSSFKKNKGTVIPNGLDISFYKPVNNIKTKPAVVGMQSRLVPIKDHTTLLKAFALVKESMPKGVVKLKIAGDGESRQALEELSGALQIENDVTFTGMLNESELLTFLQSLDVYVHASLGETMSTAIMQAMACGLPIIASDVPGINNMIKHEETGILVPVYDEKKLAASVLLLLNDTDKAGKFATASYNFALENYSNKKMFEKYWALFLGQV